MHKNLLLGTFLAIAAIALVFQGFTIFRLQTQVSELRAAAHKGAGTPLAHSLFDDLNRLTSPASPPLSGIGSMGRDMDTLFDALIQGRSLNGSNAFTFTQTSPTIELDETSDDYRIRIEVPEQSELDLSTDVENNTVRVSGRIAHKTSQSGNQLMSSFSSTSQFSRSIPLSKPVDPLALRTEKRDNSIVITIPKA